MVFLEPGEEYWEPKTMALSGAAYVEYRYVTPEGTPFICLATTVEKARAKRDAWLNSMQPRPAPVDLFPS